MADFSKEQDEALKLAPKAPFVHSDQAHCGSEHCAGCYSIGVIDGRERFLHPPKASIQWLDWNKTI